MNAKKRAVSKKKGKHSFNSDPVPFEEVQTWLKIPKSTLYKLCSEKEVPATKVGRAWMFERKSLEKWWSDKFKK